MFWHYQLYGDTTDVTNCELPVECSQNYFGGMWKAVFRISRILDMKIVCTIFIFCEEQNNAHGNPWVFTVAKNKSWTPVTGENSLKDYMEF